jgi:hypothetical protein
MSRSSRRVPTLLLLLAVASCQSKGRSSEPVAPTAAPHSYAPPPSYVPPVQPALTSAEPDSSTMGETAVLLQSARRKAMHDDGQGCIEDLERVAALDAKLASTLTVQYAQCRMLLGHCQEGKRTVADNLVRDMNLSRQRAETMAEAFAAQYCRGGDSTERDRLLRAANELTQGSYLDPRKDCEANTRLIKKLTPKVPPNGPDDHRIAGIGKTLHVQAARCHARAGDCGAAWRAFRDNHPEAPLKSLSREHREQVQRTTFQTIVTSCNTPP